MKRQRIAFVLVLTHLWALMVFLGAILFVTTVIYPNIFYDIPGSLETTMAFAAVRRPTDFFAPVGMIAVITGIGFVFSAWRVKSARYLVLGGVMILVVGEILLSMAYFWPRNTILFVEGTAVHSVVYLNQVAAEFRTGHWIRVAMSGAAAASSFIGFLRFYRNGITSSA
jgi:hypothetical protein